MGKFRNNAISDNHFKKHWRRFVTTWFTQPMRKRRRRQNRVEKAKKVAPRPISLLRPVIRCPTQRYNRKFRQGRGFSLDELKAAGVSKNEARTIGIAVDHRRRNQTLEQLQKNVARLKLYRARLIVFPRKASKPKKGDATEEQQKQAQQVTRKLLLPLPSGVRREKARKPTDQEKKFSAYEELQFARWDKRTYGKRQKKAAEAASAPDAKPAKAGGDE
jgi:large subunit ribosomal protein L13e